MTSNLSHKKGATFKKVRFEDICDNFFRKDPKAAQKKAQHQKPITDQRLSRFLQDLINTKDTSFQNSRNNRIKHLDELYKNLYNKNNLGNKNYQDNFIAKTLSLRPNINVAINTTYQLQVNQPGTSLISNNELHYEKIISSSDSDSPTVDLSNGSINKQELEDIEENNETSTRENCTLSPLTENIQEKVSSSSNITKITDDDKSPADLKDIAGVVDETKHGDSSAFAGKSIAKRLEENIENQRENIRDILTSDRKRGYNNAPKDTTILHIDKSKSATSSDASVNIKRKPVKSRKKKTHNKSRIENTFEIPSTTKNRDSSVESGLNNIGKVSDLELMSISSQSSTEELPVEESCNKTILDSTTAFEIKPNFVDKEKYDDELTHLKKSLITDANFGHTSVNTVFTLFKSNGDENSETMAVLPPGRIAGVVNDHQNNSTHQRWFTSSDMFIAFSVLVLSTILLYVSSSNNHFGFLKTSSAIPSLWFSYHVQEVEPPLDPFSNALNFMDSVKLFEATYKNQESKLWEVLRESYLHAKQLSGPGVLLLASDKSGNCTSCGLAKRIADAYSNEISQVEPFFLDCKNYRRSHPTEAFKQIQHLIKSKINKGVRSVVLANFQQLPAYTSTMFFDLFTTVNTLIRESLFIFTIQVETTADWDENNLKPELWDLIVRSYLCQSLTTRDPVTMNHVTVDQLLGNITSHTGWVKRENESCDLSFDNT